MPTAPPSYVVLIKDKAGTNTYEFEKAIDLAWEWYENEVGRCKFTIPYNDTKLSSTSISESAFSEILIYRDGELVWQGFIAYIEDNKNGVTIYGLTFTEYLKWYRVGYDVAYTTQKIGSQIISPIYDIIAAYTNDILGERITKGTIQNPYDTGSSSAEKTITKTVFDEDFFTLLKDLVGASRADSPSGSWKQDTVFEITFSATAPTFNFWRDIGTDKSDVILELDSEIVDFNFGVDFRFLYNDVKGFAVQEGPKVLTSSQIDTISRTNYYLRQISPYFGTVTNQNQLDEMSKDILKNYKDPLRSFSIQLASGLKPFDGYSMGDSIRIRINRGRVNLNEFFRVVGMEVTLDENGVETTTPLLEKKRS